MDAEQKATARKLSRDRYSLKCAIERVDRLEVRIAAGDTDQRKLPELRAKLVEEQAVVEGLKEAIVQAERSIYGEWAPKSPPSPERSLEIRRRNDEVYGE